MPEPQLDRTTAPAGPTSAPTHRPEGPGSDPRRTSLRGMSYADGERSLRPPPPPVGRNELDLAQRSFQSAYIGATLDKERSVPESNGVAVQLDAGTRFSASIDGGGITFGAEPGILLKLDWRPDIRLTRIRYDFRTGRFDVSADANWIDVFHIIGGLAEDKIEATLEKELKPKLPKKVQTPGYSPKTDRDLSGTVAELQGVFAAFDGTPEVTNAGGGGGGAAGTPGGELANLKDLAAGVTVSSPQEYVVPLADGLEMVIAAGLRLDLNASTGGPATKPKLNRLTLSAWKPGIVFRGNTSELAKSLKALEMNSITVLPGGRFSFDYDLVPEKLVDGGIALIALLSLATGHDPGALPPPTRLESIRKEIDARLQQEAPPRLREMLLQYDTILPGLSLRSIVGVE